MTVDRIELWFWEVKDELTGKWERVRYQMTEEYARARIGGNARKVEGTLEVRGISMKDERGRRSPRSVLQPPFRLRSAPGKDCDRA